MVNFRQPYLATSLRDFWRRWHISLSTWLRDYLYIPLGGNRYGEGKTYRNLMSTMVIGGFWHGANWTFVIWGMIHGLGLAFERMIGGVLGSEDAEARSSQQQQRSSHFFLGRWLARAFIFHLVCLAWVFFRAQSLGDAFNMLSGISILSWRLEYFTALKYLAFFAIPMMGVDLVNEYRGEEYVMERSSPRLRIAFAASLLLGLTCFSGNEINAFIYFQF
jgi:D-alanyl-lipoteichoic acid acyltransferase DltB (MBOAT superfamily)